MTGVAGRPACANGAVRLIPIFFVAGSESWGSLDNVSWGSCDCDAALRFRVLGGDVVSNLTRAKSRRR